MKRNGWEVKRIKGSHYIMKKDNEIEVVPVHNKDLKAGLENAIIKRFV